MRCAYCPLYSYYESEDGCYANCGLFGDGWDNRLQYEDKHGTTIGCYVEKCYIVIVAKEYDEYIETMAEGMAEMLKKETEEKL